LVPTVLLVPLPAALVVRMVALLVPAVVVARIAAVVPLVLAVLLVPLLAVHVVRVATVLVVLVAAMPIVPVVVANANRRCTPGIMPTVRENAAVVVTRLRAEAAFSLVNMTALRSVVAITTAVTIGLHAAQAFAA